MVNDVVQKKKKKGREKCTRIATIAEMQILGRNITRREAD